MIMCVRCYYGWWRYGDFRFKENGQISTYFQDIRVLVVGLLQVHLRELSFGYREISSGEETWMRTLRGSPYFIGSLIGLGVPYFGTPTSSFWNLNWLPETWFPELGRLRWPLGLLSTLELLGLDFPIPSLIHCVFPRYLSGISVFRLSIWGYSFSLAFLDGESSLFH